MVDYAIVGVINFRGCVFFDRGGLIGPSLSYSGIGARPLRVPAARDLSAVSFADWASRADCIGMHISA